MGVLDVPFNRNVNVNNLENPFATYEGQQVVSTSESYWARLARIGTIYNDYRSGTSYTSGGSVTIALHGTTLIAGHVFIPQAITISATTDSLLQINFRTGNSPSNVASSIPVYAKAYTPFVYYFDGSVQIHNLYKFGSSNQGSLQAQVTDKSSTAGTMTCSVVGFNVPRADI